MSRSGWNAQCSSYGAPESIQRPMVSTSSDDSDLPESDGGMWSSASVVETRFQSSLAARSFGTTATFSDGKGLYNTESLSTRRSALRFVASAP